MNYRDIVVRLGVSGVETFNARLGAAAQSLKRLDEAAIARTRSTNAALKAMDDRAIAQSRATAQTLRQLDDAAIRQAKSLSTRFNQLPTQLRSNLATTSAAIRKWDQESIAAAQSFWTRFGVAGQNAGHTLATAIAAAPAAALTGLKKGGDSLLTALGVMNVAAMAKMGQLSRGVGSVVMGMSQAVVGGVQKLSGGISRAFGKVFGGPSLAALARSGMGSGFIAAEQEAVRGSSRLMSRLASIQTGVQTRFRQMLSPANRQRGSMNFDAMVDDLFGGRAGFGRASSAQALTQAEQLVRARKLGAQNAARVAGTIGFGPPGATSAVSQMVPIKSLLPLVHQENFTAASADKLLPKIVQSVQTYGIRNPLVVQVDKAGAAQLADGHHRLLAAQQLGMTHVPVAMQRSGLASIPGAVPLPNQYTGNRTFFSPSQVGLTSAAPVVDRNGVPIRMLHASPRPLGEFDFASDRPGRQRFGRGAYFTADPRVAHEFAGIDPTGARSRFSAAKGALSAPHMRMATLSGNVFDYDKDILKRGEIDRAIRSFYGSMSKSAQNAIGLEKLTRHDVNATTAKGLFGELNWHASDFLGSSRAGSRQITRAHNTALDTILQGRGADIVRAREMGGTVYAARQGGAIQSPYTGLAGALRNRLQAVTSAHGGSDAGVLPIGRIMDDLKKLDTRFFNWANTVPGRLKNAFSMKWMGGGAPFFNLSGAQTAVQHQLSSIGQRFTSWAQSTSQRVRNTFSTGWMGGGAPFFNLSGAQAQAAKITSLFGRINQSAQVAWGSIRLAGQQAWGGLGSVASTAGGAMSSALTTVRGKLSSMGSGIATAGRGFRDLFWQWDNGTRTMGKLGKMMQESATASRGLGYAMLGLGAIFSVVFFGGIKAAANFEEQMRNVSSIAKGNGDTVEQVKKQYQDLSASVLDLGGKLPMGPIELAKALYEVASAGYVAEKAAEGVTILRVAAESASAGLADTVQTAQALVAVINSYGFATKDASFISDVLFQTVRTGIVTFQQLTQQLGDFIGFAAILNNSNMETEEGVTKAKNSLIDLGVAFATMTRAGIPAAEASTSMNRVLQALVKPSVAMKQQLHELGFENGQAAASMALTSEQADKLNVILAKGNSVFRAEAGHVLGVVGTLQVLRASVGGNISAIQKLFPEIRAARGAYGIMADQGKLAAEVTDQFGDAAEVAGSRVRALEEQQKGLNFQWRTTKSAIETLKIQLGTGLLPVMKGIVGTVQDMINWWTHLSGSMKMVIEGVGALMAVIFLLGGAILVLGPRALQAAAALNTLGVSTAALKTAMFTTAGVLGVVVGAMTIAGAIFAIHAKRTADNRAETELYVSALQDEAGALGAVTDAAIRKQLADKGMIDAINELGIPIETLVSYIKGSSTAADELGTILGKMTPQDLIDHQDALNKVFGTSAGVMSNTAYAATALAQGLEDGKGPVDTMRSNFADAAKKVNDSKKAMEGATPVSERMAAQLKSFGLDTKSAANAMDTFGKSAEKLPDNIKALAKVFDSIGSPAQAFKDAEAALKPLMDSMEVYTDALNKKQEKLDEAAQAQSENYNNALKASTQAEQDAARAVKEAAHDSLAYRQKVSKSAREGARDVGNAATQQAREVARANSLAKKSTEDFKQKATLAVGEYAKALEEAGEKQKKYRENLAKLYTMARDGKLDVRFVDELRDKGKEASDLVAALANANGESIGKIKAAYASIAPSVDQSFTEWSKKLHERAEGVRNFHKTLMTLMSQGGKDFVDALLASDLSPDQQAQIAKGALGKSAPVLKQIATDLHNITDLGAGELLQSLEPYWNALSELKTQTGAVDFNAIANTAGVKDGAMSLVTYLNTELGPAIKNLPKQVQVQLKVAAEQSDIIAATESDIASIDKAVKDKKLHPKLAQIEKDELLPIVAAAKKKLQEALDGGPKPKIKTEVTGDPSQVDEVLETDRPRTIKLHVEVENPDDVPGEKPKEPAATNPYSGYGRGGGPGGNASNDPRANKLDGGLMQFFARGGLRENHVAEIAPANTVRVWAEPETGGEAYIPMSMSKRMRSVKILEEVADRFGYQLMKYANGGVSGGPKRPIGVTSFGAQSAAPVVHVSVSAGDGTPQKIENNWNFKDVTVKANDPADFQRQMARKRRRANLAGGVQVART